MIERGVSDKTLALLVIAALVYGALVVLPAVWGAVVLRVAERVARRAAGDRLPRGGASAAGLLLGAAAAGSSLVAASLPQFLPRAWKSGAMTWALLAAVFAATHGATTVAAWLVLRRGTEPARGWLTAAGAAAVFLAGWTAGAVAAAIVVYRIYDDPLVNF